MTIQSKLDKFYYYYFLIHIPITIFMDSSLIIPHNYQLNITRQLINFHITTNKDFLLAVPIEPWLKIFGLIELLFQLPFFIISVAGQLPYKQVWNLIYAVNVTITTMCCLIYIGLQYDSHGLQCVDAVKLLLIYLPYLVIGLVMGVDSFKRIATDLPSKARG